MMMGNRKNRKRQLTTFLVGYLCLALAGPVTPAMAAPGDIVTNGTSSGLTVPNAFLFEPEVPFTSLKNVPTWSELEQLLDNPYLVTPDPSTPGNDSGFPSYRATGMIRRPGFGVTLPSFLVHPLNYNPTTGEEMRLINPGFNSTDLFPVVDQLVQCNSILGLTTPGCAGTVTAPGPAGPVVTGPFSADRYVWRYVSMPISPGAARVEPGEAHIDYNNPIPADTFFCAVSLELTPPEGSTLCGGDPGEPGYTGPGAGNGNNVGFGFRRQGAASNNQYSLPAVPLAVGPIGGQAQMWLPGAISPRV